MVTIRKIKPSGIHLLAAMGIALIAFMHGSAQTISYTKPLKDDKVNTWFDILGTFNHKLLVLKKFRSSYHISVYNEQMEWLENIDLPQIPEKAYEVEAIQLKDHLSIWYRESKGRITKWSALKVGFDGKPLGEPVLITSHETEFTDYKRYYYLTTSEDRMWVMATITRELKEDRYRFENLLFTQKLDSVKGSVHTLENVKETDFFTELFHFGLNLFTGNHNAHCNGHWQIPKT